MDVHIKTIPEWVTRIFGVSPNDTCKVLRMDAVQTSKVNEKLYLIQTKTGKNVTVYSHEINEIEAN